MIDEHIYYLAEETRINIQKNTGESIVEWGSGFQVISDMAAAYLSGTLVRGYFDVSEIHPELAFPQVKTIICQAADRLGYERIFDNQFDSHHSAEYLEFIDAWKYYSDEEGNDLI